MTSHLTAAVLAGAVLSTPAAFAADDGPAYTFSGYGTLGFSHSSEKEADFITRYTQPNGAGHTRNWSFDTDSRLAGQLTANFNSQWSAVLQIVAEQRADNSYTPQVEWANIQFMPTPDISIRAGRIVLPTLLMGNTRKVGYALPWVRMPSSLFQNQPNSSSDGVDASYSQHFGAIKNTIMASAGKKSLDLGSGALAGFKVRATKIRTVTDTLLYRNLTVQFSHLQGDVAISGAPVKGSYRLNSLGASYDPGQWYVMGEWARTNFSFSGRVTNWYAGGGYRIADFTPYIVVDRRSPGSNPAAPVPPQKTHSAGLRWDVARNIDLKVQYDRNSHPAGSSGVLVNLQPGFQPGGTYHVVSTTVDFVF